MSTLQSPTGPGGSQPDLSKLNYKETDFPPRKRKQPDDDIKSQFNEFQEQMSGFFKDFLKMQNEKLTKISEDVSAINDNLKKLQCTTENLISEQSKIKTELADLTKTQNNTEEKIKLLEGKIESLQDGTGSQTKQSPQQSLNCEEIVSEFQERNKREKNLIITGVPELHSTKQAERSSFDVTEVSNITKIIIANCPEPVKAIRLGKYNPDKKRPIKAFFETSDIVKSILRNKSKANIDGIKIYSDQTPYQQKVMHDMKEEIKTRTDNGEENLTIKYVKGIPKIMQRQEPKN